MTRHDEYLQASNKLAENVELRLTGCKLLTRVSTMTEGEQDTTETSLVKAEMERRTSKVVKIRAPRHHVSYSLVEEHKATITVGVIMGVFLLCWGPFFITNIVSGLCKVSVTRGTKYFSNS